MSAGPETVGQRTARRASPGAAKIHAETMLEPVFARRFVLCLLIKKAGLAKPLIRAFSSIPFPRASGVPRLGPSQPDFYPSRPPAPTRTDGKPAEIRTQNPEDGKDIHEKTKTVAPADFIVKSTGTTVLSRLGWQEKGQPFSCPRWCARGESNPHARNEHRHLKPASLPIPPLAHLFNLSRYPERLIIVPFSAENVNCYFCFFRKKINSELRRPPPARR